MILVDSNIWICFLDAEAREHAAVEKALPALLKDHDALLPAPVQLEVLHYLSRQVDEGLEEIIDDFLSQPGEVEPLTGAVVSECSRLLAKHRGLGLGGRDAALLVMARNRGATLATADKALARVAKKVGISVVNPASG
ncbi:MAG: PIN domain-containing protein [Euryarchaeota archaeon]|nr:PIN domain-containing protein [Euryarchaeota archaeon]